VKVGNQIYKINEREKPSPTKPQEKKKPATKPKDPEAWGFTMAFELQKDQLKELLNPEALGETFAPHMDLVHYTNVNVNSSKLVITFANNKFFHKHCTSLSFLTLLTLFH